MQVLLPIGFQKYWAIQEDIQLEDRSVGGRESGAGGNYTRNLEQSAGGYMYREVPQRESPNAGQVRAGGWEREQ